MGLDRSSGRVASAKPLLAVDDDLPLSSDAVYHWTVETFPTHAGVATDAASAGRARGAESAHSAGSAQSLGGDAGSVETTGSARDARAVTMSTSVSEAARFTSGLLAASDWDGAEWIDAGM